MRRLAVLRPEPGATETVERARSLGMEAFAVSLFRVEPVDWTAPDPSRFDALLLTSANAVRHGGKQLESLRGLPAHAVGGATAEAAREAGFAIAGTGDGGVERLLGSIAPDLRLLHLCGEHRRAPSETPQQITPIAVYRSTAIATAEDLAMIEGAVVLVHSPRAGERLAELADTGGVDRSTITIAAISEAAANMAGRGWERVESAAEPNDRSLLALAARLCDKGCQE